MKTKLEMFYPREWCHIFHLYCLLVYIWQWAILLFQLQLDNISRGLTEAQSQKIENRMHLPKQFEIYFIWAAKLNIAIKPRREWLLYWGMDWPDGGRQGGGPRRECRQDEMVLRMFYVEHSCLQVGSVLGGKKWAGVKPWVVTKIFS